MNMHVHVHMLEMHTAAVEKSWPVLELCTRGHTTTPSGLPTLYENAL